MKRISRRTFTQATAAIGATAVTNALAAQTTPTSQTKSAEPIRIGFIGVGNRGDQVLSAFLEH